MFLIVWSLWTGQQFYLWEIPLEKSSMPGRVCAEVHLTLTPTAPSPAPHTRYYKYLYIIIDDKIVVEFNSFKFTSHTKACSRVLENEKKDFMILTIYVYKLKYKKVGVLPIRIV